ncbi:MAG: M36 family metallopeptidase [Candidatus Eremiobacteraeota bacterium]|nr:M36 family metallopeptidase [Candidatus Eremiobacteraeota bacterium]MCW5869020.1 M36 family metallopeptidase [Candidatus Eremiobacteraeota bacterium]
MKIAYAAQAPALSKVKTYSQDSMVGPVIEDTIEISKIGRRLEGPRVGVWDQEVMKASADSQGNYLYGPESRKFDQVQAFVSSQKTLDLFEGYAQRTLPWAFEGETLGVGPHAGEGANAYYQRSYGSLSFYYFDSKALGRRVQTSQSADVVSHETGHAILDGLKPEFGRTFDRETKAYHEAFGDCAAMLLTLSRPANREAILKETGGDLRKENCLSRMGEEFGYAVRRMNKDDRDDRDYLRTHLNDFRYIDPNTLPADGPREKLTGEAHSFCQVWTRAFYDTLAGLFEKTGDMGKAGEIGGNLLTLGTHMVSPTRARYSQLAGAMLRADQLLYGGENSGILRQAFEKAGIECAQEMVPEFNWSQPPADLAEAQPLLDQLGPGGFQAQRILKDGHGFTVVEGVHSEVVRCGQDKASEVSQGMSLTFDPSGRLIHKVVDDPSAHSEAIGMRDEITRSQPGLPATWRSLRELGDGTQLVERLPVFID